MIPLRKYRCMIKLERPAMLGALCGPLIQISKMDCIVFLALGPK